MYYYIITGTSSGLGKALAETALQQSDVTVIGVARRVFIHHARYRHHSLDLSDIGAVEQCLRVLFPPLPDAEGITLLNNAGILGEIGYAGELPNKQFKAVFDTNVTAPAVLMNAFLSAYAGRTMPRTILNISSGAAQRPVDGWSAYCASKAALDMLSEVAQKEQNLRGSGVRIRSLAPGVIDTDMQAHIRAADKARFSEITKFNTLHTEAYLSSPAMVAEKIVGWLHRPSEIDEKVILRIDDIA